MRRQLCRDVALQHMRVWRTDDMGQDNRHHSEQSGQQCFRFHKEANPKRRGQDEVEVLEATLSADGKSLFLEIEDLQPVMQMQIGYTLQSADGREVRDNFWLTINQPAED